MSAWNFERVDASNKVGKGIWNGMRKGIPILLLLGLLNVDLTRAAATELCFAASAANFGDLTYALEAPESCPGSFGRSRCGLPTLPEHRLTWALNSSTAVFFVGNATRMETAKEYRSDARWGMVGYSWDVNLGESSARPAEQWEVDEARALHRENAAAAVMVTREVSSIANWYDSINISDPHLASWFIQCDGKPCLSPWNVSKINGMHAPTFAHWINWSNPEARDWWVQDFVGGELRQEQIAGVFLDTGPPPKLSAFESIEACAQAGRDAQRAFGEAVQLAASLGKWITTQGAVGGAVTCAPWQNTGLQPTMCDSCNIAGCQGRHPITAQACAAASRKVIAQARALAAANLTFQLFSQGGAWWEFRDQHPEGKGDLSNATINRAAFEAQVALFQIARGRSALLQWHDYSFTETSKFPWDATVLKKDYGTPVGGPEEVAPGVFQREWSSGLVRLNCSDFARVVAAGVVLQGAKNADSIYG